METIVILQAIGFVVCFILLFVFTAKYRSALANETNFGEAVENLEVVTVPQKPTYQPRAALLRSLPGKDALQLNDVKEELQNLYYRLEEFKAAQRKHTDDITKKLSHLEHRMSTFEQEYMNKLQPTLISLIRELESMKSGADKAEFSAENSTEDYPEEASQDNTEDEFEAQLEETSEIK